MTSEIDTEVAPSGDGCVECDRAGGWWFHLRRCTACGHVGCCDSSPSAHASGHAAASGHPVMTSYEPGEYWFYDVRSGRMFDGPDLAPPRHHPDAQPAPGPRDRVPGDWRQRLR